MNEENAVILIVGGAARITASLCTKKAYAAKGFYAAMLSDRSIPLWMGRLIFCTVDGVMISVGLLFFFPNW